VTDPSRSIPSARGSGHIAALEVRELTKEFGGHVALDHVSLTIRLSEVHGLVGHNGSGKSTLIKALAGFHAPDGGTVSVGGVALKLGDPDASRRAGLRFIHQDLGLVDGLSVLENLKLGTDSWATGLGARIRWQHEYRTARELLAQFDVQLDPRALVGDLTPVDRTQLAIVRALQDIEQVRVLVLDEPTATLPDEQVDSLMSLVNRVSAQGIGVLYVSHRLEELYRICDGLTVLRDGVAVAEGDVGSISEPELVQLIVGSSAVETGVTSAAGKRASNGAVVFSTSQLSSGRLRSLTMDAQAGEVIGVAGLVGSGVQDLVQLLSGRGQDVSGSVAIHGSTLKRVNPFTLKRAGVAVLSSSRDLKGMLDMSVRENLMITDLSPIWKRGWLRHGPERSIVSRIMSEFEIRPSDPESKLSALSGGNQQKVAVAKWVRTDISVLVLDEPTAGVDVAGRAYVLQTLRKAADEGMCVILCSSDLGDLSEICDRVIVLRGGVNALELSKQPLNRDQIARECYRSA
jgi:ribose transport system ATP-binding protein